MVLKKQEQERQAWAAQIDRDARASFGVKSWQETCTANIPSNWACTVMDMESPSEGDLTVLLMVDKDEAGAKDLAEGAAHALFNLLQVEHPELEMIQVLHAGGGSLAIMHRSEALPLEK